MKYLSDGLNLIDTKPPPLDWCEKIFEFLGAISVIVSLLTFINEFGKLNEKITIKLYESSN